MMFSILDHPGLLTIKR